MGMGQNLVDRISRRVMKPEAAAAAADMMTTTAASTKMPRLVESDEEHEHQFQNNDHSEGPKEPSESLSNHELCPRQMELKIPFQSLAVTTATSQISALVFCLAWSVKFNFYESTATHCRVDNYLPSLSATLDFTPQRDVWRACIGLSGIPRYFIAYLYYNIIFRSKLLLWFHWIEITALIGLSIVDSIRYFAFHATCVGVFLSTSIIHMALVCNNHVKPVSSNLSEKTRLMLKMTKTVKRRIAILNFVTIVTALYLYDRHNRYCEPGVYSMFSFLEYIVIVANIIYHLQAYYDLHEYSIIVARVGQSTKSTIAAIASPSTKKKIS